MFTMFSLRVVVSLLFVFRIVYSARLEEGDQCPLSGGTKGVCKLITDCPSALAQLQQGVFPENICGFLGTQSIVCCKGSSQPPTSPLVTPSPPTKRPQSPVTSKPSKPSITTRTPGEISKQKCKQYARYAYDDSESPALGIVTHFAHTLECAFEKLELIVGGTLASRQEFPHMALIGYDTSDGVSWACGGSIISENFVLTAAHCLRSNLGPAKYVRAGITNQTETWNLQERTVAEIIVHPSYTSSSKYHDIGLLRLSKDYDLNIYVRPACLQTAKRIPFEKAIASGWGKIEFSGPGSNDLLKVVLEFFDVTKCNATYRRDINAPDSYIEDGIIDSSMLCAGSTKDFKDTCQGDSGGPLQVYHEETQDIKCMYDIVGITSFGKSCGLAKNIPGVYTRVSEYIKWIEDKVWT